MKTFSAFTEAAFDSPHTAPIRLLEIDFAGFVIYLCDRVWGDAGSECVFNGKTYDPLIVSWGKTRGGRINPTTGSSEPTLAAIVVDNNTPVGGADRFTALFSRHDIHYAGVTESVIPEGASAAGDAVCLFKGSIEAPGNITAETLTTELSGLELDIAQRFVHEILDTATFPGADPDDVGKMLPQIYGSAKKVPFLAIDTGAVTTLVTDINSTTTTLVFSDFSRFPTSGTIISGAEEITYTGKSGNSPTGVTRGANGTTKAAHYAGDGFAEVKSEYVYAAGCAVKAIDDVYVGPVRQDGNFTAYTGQSGDEHAAYTGRACIAFTGDKVNKKLREDVLTESVTAGPLASYSTDSDIGYGETNTGNGGYTLTIHNAGLPAGPYWTPSWAAANSDDGYIEVWSWAITVASLGTVGTVQVYINGFDSARTLVFEIDTGVITVEPVNPKQWAHASPDAPGGSGTFEVVLAGNFDGSVSTSLSTVQIILSNYEFTTISTRTGVVNYTGNSTADTVIGGLVAADADGFQDDGSGTYTGTPNALIERADHILKHLIIAKCGKTASEIDAADYAAAGAYFSANSFVLGFAILMRPNVRMLINRIANQTKAIDCWEAGVHHLIHIPDTESRDGLIEAARIDLGRIRVKYTPRVDIQNSLSARYLRYWSGHETEIEADREVVTATDADSVSRYGALEGDQRSYPYIAATAQAQAVLDREKTDRAGPRLLVDFTGGIYLSRFEPGDIVKFDLFTGVDTEAEAYLDSALVELLRDTAWADTDDTAWADTADCLWAEVKGTTPFRVIDKSYLPEADVQLEVMEVI